jgi:large subunit ribosomal protein L4
MADAPILGGKASDKVKLDDDVFGAPFNGPLVHEVVVAELAARRRGTHSTRNRALVRGGGAKPWRQKGTGRARQGTIRAPHFSGGGVAFGPTPRHYILKVNRKARRAALRCALSIHAERGSVFALDAGGFDTPSTKQAADLIADRRGGSVLIVLTGPDEASVFKSFRNLAGVNVLASADCGVADLIGAASVVFSKDALDEVTARASKKTRPDAGHANQVAGPDAPRSNKTGAA